MDREQVKRWAAGYHAAADRQLELARAEGPASPDASFAAALELCALVDLGAPDPVREREVAAARAAWRRVRAWAASRG